MSYCMKNIKVSEGRFGCSLPAGHDKHDSASSCQFTRMWNYKDKYTPGEVKR